MTRTSWRTAVVTIAGFVTLAAWRPHTAAAQTLVPQPTPQSHVLEAKRLLGDVAASPTTDVGKQIARLQVDFTAFASSFLSGAPSPSNRQTPGAVGTSGTAAASAADWRSKYAAVERDLTALIGSTDPQSPDRGRASLDPTVRKQLQEVQRNLELFEVATRGQQSNSPPMPSTTSVVPPPALTVADIDTGTVAALLDRMQTLVERLNGDTDKTTGTAGSLSSSGRVEVERQSLAELRAEIAQLRTMLTANR